jgi:hypothetical protein
VRKRRTSPFSTFFAWSKDSSEDLTQKQQKGSEIAQKAKDITRGILDVSKALAALDLSDHSSIKSFVLPPNFLVLAILTNLPSDYSKESDVGNALIVS